MLITRYCNLIGTANIPAAHTKTCQTYFFPSPLFGARNIRARAKYVQLAGLGRAMCAPAPRYLDDGNIIESVDSISRDERDVPLTQYITNA